MNFVVSLICLCFQLGKNWFKAEEASASRSGIRDVINEEMDRYRSCEEKTLAFLKNILLSIIPLYYVDVKDLFIYIYIYHSYHMKQAKILSLRFR